MPTFAELPRGGKDSSRSGVELPTNPIPLFNAVSKKIENELDPEMGQRGIVKTDLELFQLYVVIERKSLTLPFVSLAREIDRTVVGY